MTQHLARAAALAAVVLLLGACAGRCVRCVPSAPKEAKDSKDANYYNWTYRETMLDPFWWTTLVDVPTARKNFGTGGGATVAIVGTGVLNGHEDLPKIVPGKATCGSKPDDANDTTNGHGTQLAGITLGRDPGHATRGMAPDTALIPIKVDCGVVSAEALTNGVDAAIASKPDVILIAIGGYPSGPPDFEAFMLKRVNDNPGILFVVASVWDGTHEYAFPAWTQTANALVVASMTLDAEKTDRKKVSKREIPYGARRGNIWAPGRSIETADIELEPGSPTTHSQFSMHGTSPAAAIVAGCAALIKGKTGTGGAALKSALLSGVDTAPDLAPAGRLNCGKAAVPPR